MEICLILKNTINKQIKNQQKKKNATIKMSSNKEIIKYFLLSFNLQDSLFN